MSIDLSHDQPNRTSMSSVSTEQFEKLVEVISRSQRSYRALIDSLDQALFTLSPKGEVLVANLRLAEMLCVSFSDLIGHSLSELIESTLADPQTLPDLLAKGSYSGKVAVRLKGREEVRQFSCWLQVVSEKGHAVSITGWARDVSREHEAEEIERRLHEEQELRRRLIANFPDLIAVLDRNGRFTFVSDQVKQILGWAPEEYLGAQIGARASAGDRAELEAMVQSILSGATARAQLEFNAQHKDGSWVTLLATAGPLFDEKGSISGVITSARDITETRRIEKQLHREQEFARRLIECFPHQITVVDREGRFTFVSERVREILGMRSEDYLGKLIGQGIDTEDQRKILELHRDIVSGRKRHGQVEIQSRHADGSLRSIQVNASPLYDEKGEIVGMVSSGQDVTESRRIEQQLVQKEKFAAMGQMMVGAAHELNNPLTAILGVADLLRERAPDDPTRRQVDLVLKQARRAATIVQNLLAFSRPVTLGRAKLNLAEVLREVLQPEQPVLERSKIQLKFESSENLPSVEGDRKLLKEVFVNIIANAERAISAARDHGTLSVKLSAAGGFVRVSVADDGMGIAPENVGKIFDPFFTTKRTGGSSGLGLTICLAVVKEHGGRIETESRLGSGATFHILLPVSAEAASSAPASDTSGKAAQTAAAGTLRGHTAIVVDDEESIREIVQEGLLARGMKVEAFGSSEAALAHLATNQCDAIICDFNLPGMNGEELFEQVRGQQSGKTPRFVFMTGDLLDPVVVDRYCQSGATILQKPFHVAGLADILIELLKPQPAQVG